MQVHAYLSSQVDSPVSEVRITQGMCSDETLEFFSILRTYTTDLPIAAGSAHYLPHVSAAATEKPYADCL